MKKFFGLALAVVLAAAAMSVPVSAAEAKEVTAAEFLALDADGDGKITLAEDVTLTSSLITTADLVIDLGGNTLSVTGGDHHFNSKVEFQNGTIDISGAVANGDCIFGVGNYSTDGTLTLQDVDLVGTDYSSAYAVVYVYGASTLNVINGSTLVLTNELFPGSAALRSETSTGNINVIDSEVKIVNGGNGIHTGRILIQNSKVTMKDLTDNGFNNNRTSADKTDITFDNAQVSVTGCGGRALTLYGANDDAQIVIKNGSSVVLEDSAATEYDVEFKSGGKIIVEDIKSNISFETYKTATGSDLTDLSSCFVLLNGTALKTDEEGVLSVVCNHVNTKKDENSAAAASCTETGKAADEICALCGVVIAEGKEIPAAGHTYVDGKCACGAVQEQGTTSPETGDAGYVLFIVAMAAAIGGVVLSMKGLRRAR